MKNNVTFQSELTNQLRNYKGHTESHEQRRIVGNSATLNY